MTLTQLFNEVENKLSEDDFQNLTEFVEHNEYGLAFETLCTQLYESDIEISQKFYDKIALYGNSIQISSSAWLLLKKLIRD